MPFLSYDPALTIASGAELGLLAAIALAPAIASPADREAVAPREPQAVAA
jgi:hypothetical protein